jgi:hypothetical protein
MIKLSFKNFSLNYFHRLRPQKLTNEVLLNYAIIFLFILFVFFAVFDGYVYYSFYGAGAGFAEEQEPVVLSVSDYQKAISILNSRAAMFESISGASYANMPNPFR